MFGRSKDRISNLSDALLIHILSFLKTKDAIMSSVLSKRWSNLWTFVPNLSFEEDDFESRKSFKIFVTQVLLRRAKSDVIKVRYEDDSYAITLLAESVVHYAVRHSVQELYLSLSDEEKDLFVLPRCLIDCQSLRKLELVDSSHKIRVPGYLGLNALKHLSLSGFSLSEEYLDWRSLSSCPNLETLILNYHCLPNAGTFHIYALNLRRLELVCESDIELETGFKFIVSAPRLITFDFFSPLPIVCSMDCPSLEQAIIYVHHESKMEESLCVYSLKLLNECRNAKSIVISLDTLKVLSAFPALLEEHHSTFSQLECLSLHCDGDYSDFELAPCIFTYFQNGSSSMTVRVCSK